MHSLNDEYESTDFDEVPSKTQIKREMHALRVLGERIATLPRKQRDLLPKSPRLAAALEEFDRIKAREARRRHLSFLGKVLREEDLDGIHAQLELLDASSAANVRAQHALEAWRDALVASDAPLEALIERWPGIDRPRLRNAVRAARREAQAPGDGPPQKRRFRELFQLLREETAQGARLEPPPRTDT